VSEPRFAIFGTGFWSQFQLAAWQELHGPRCVAVYNRTLPKAEALAERFGVPAVYDDPEKLLDAEEIDFVDIITDASTHEMFVGMVADRRLPAICQKPMAPSLEAAERMVAKCSEAGVPLLIHENWRWQPQIRALKDELNGGAIGRPVRARVQYLSSLTVWDQQPFLREVEDFIIADMGSHILDVARFLFGEAETVYAHTARVHEELKGEDVATVMMRMGADTTVLCELSYAATIEHERPSETYVFIEGAKGSIDLGPDYTLKTTTKEGTVLRRIDVPHHDWEEWFRFVVHASIVPCNANLLLGVTGEGEAESTGADNLETIRLVYAAYDSARSGEVVRLR
jgi:predicted dehydrogenase